MSYLGKSPTGTGIRSRYYYTATGGETSISGADDSGATLIFTDGAYVDVYLNGVLLVAGTDYNTSTANTIGGLSALAGSDIVEVLVYDTFTVADAVKASSGGTFNGGVTVSGDLTVDTNTLYVDSTNNRVGIGTTSPSQSLHVVGEGLFEKASADSVVAVSSTGGSGRSYQIRSQTSGDFYIYDNTAGAARVTIDSSGNLLVGKTSVGVANVGAELRDGVSDYSVTGVSSSSPAALFGRNTDDGDVIRIRQDNITEGSISVSGTTVSYNGGHLSRWSRLSDDSKDTSIVKGTVMTNLDEMVEWGDEDNEQLNKMAVSSVEGDANVAGVFVNWDDDDNWNDMNIAMTGDMVIRIAQGTTVQRGDLLMSAGDGTAKPQGDDIVRSKTIAKVTSTHVSHTYDDGSYLVPCVLMAC